MEFGVLGPLRVVVSGRVVSIASARQRAVLAVLLLSANRTVPTVRLVDAVWGERPADSAQNLVRTYVWRLRALLAEDGERRLVTQSAGYLLRVEPGELDLSTFDWLAGQGRAALVRGEASDAAKSLRTALGLWRGEPFADVTLYDGDQAAEVQRLAEARVAGLEERIEADLALGRHEALIGELQQFALQHPLRERVAGQLMLACYRSGRQGDALAVYRHLRTLLVEELGMEPGRELRDLHQRILRADPDLLTGRAMRRAGERIVPRQLPATPGHFVGRVDELKALTGLLDRAAQAGGTVVISAISGTAGIGKTTLAVYWGRQNLQRFPDGQLHVNLRGFAPGTQPMTPAEAIHGFLGALAVPPGQIPNTLDEQTALYRSLLAGKRMLVVLDNTRDTDQVRPLLPGSPTCLTLITSRNPLAGLIAAEAAHPITLNLLTPAEAHDLLTARLGPERTAAEPDATAKLIKLCVRLPLALSIAAARATIDPALPLTDLVAELHDARDRLDALDIGDTTTNLRAVFSWSYRRLTPPAARIFRLLGVHAGPDITAAATASLAGIPLAEAHHRLDELAQAHMLDEHTTGRYAFHDLLRAYATEQTHTHDTHGERREALHRVLDHYLHTAHTAALLLNPHRDPLTMDLLGTVPEELGDPSQASAWFEAEHRVLLMASAEAADTGFDTHAWQIPWTLADFLDMWGHWHNWATILQTALAAAQRSNDLAGQAYVHRTIARARTMLGSYDEAYTHLQSTLELYRKLGDHVGQASTHLGLGRLSDRQSRHSEALNHSQQALKLFKAANNRAREADALNAIGWCHTQLGDYVQALASCQQALALEQQLGDRTGEASTWDSLGYAHHHLGDYVQALASYQQAVNLFQELGVRYYEADTLAHLGDTHHATDNTQAARDAWQQALTILDDLNHPDAEQVRAKLRASEG